MEDLQTAVIVLIVAVIVAYGVYLISTFDYCPYYYHGIHCLPIKQH